MEIAAASLCARRRLLEQLKLETAGAACASAAQVRCQGRCAGPSLWERPGLEAAGEARDGRCKSNATATAGTARVGRCGSSAR